MVIHSKLSQVFSHQSWIHAVSGAAGGCIAMSAFYPLDTVRSRLQVENFVQRRKARSTIQMVLQIVLEEGCQSLYRGLFPVLESLCISNFVYFYTFHTLKALYVDDNIKQSAFMDLLLGSIAGIVNVLMTTPFWVVNTRLRMRNIKRTDDKKTLKQQQPYRSLLSGLRFVAKTEGVRGLWSGTIASLILVTNPALQFMMYEMLKRNMMTTTKYATATSLYYFIIGAISKAFATILTYPLQLVQTKQRHNGSNTSNADNESSLRQATGMIEIMKNILKHQGIKGLYRGLEAKILQTVLTAALMFTAYEKIAKIVSLLLARNRAAVVK